MGLHLTGNNIPSNLYKIRQIENSSEAIRELQQQKLKSLLEHASETVPYYNALLKENDVVSDGGIKLDNFEKLPLLTKEDIRSADGDLHSSAPGPNPYSNTSGGTTGEPVEFLQDDRYWQWNVANKIYYHSLAGKGLGEPEIKLWGSERDIQKGSRSLKTRIRNFLYNRQALNSFKMSEEDMEQYIREINQHQPKSIWAYVESMHQLSQYAKKNNLKVYSPAGIVTTAGTLHEPVRETIEDVFDTKVHNQYGSREVGDIACECPHQEGLHIFTHSNYVEIVDEDGNPVPSGEEGYVAVTNLTNYTMPLIRYKIGDMAVGSDESCSCGRGFPLLKKVTGRESDHFVTPTGELIHGEYFTHLFYNKDWVRKFQVHQISRESLVIKIVKREPEDGADLEAIKSEIRNVMGEEVEIEVEFKEEISPSSSGKFRYIVSEVL
ncbi:phenylacetate--CoA ligase family protein [Haloarcula halophila]|uniref:phenylacetate--CoA ligase family protein n=1 Tax=Haloarcula TaxID=2237 RepID=UPI0023E47313|nr:hypothetical protein [Halomicroarcula sp. DFY41]